MNSSGLSNSPPIIIVMGISGSGKTRVGSLLAERLGVDFFDGDEFHPTSNVAKMAAGRPLSDEDRAPWLLAIRAKIDELQRRGEAAVIACSALKEQYRRMLKRNGESILFVHLSGERELIVERLGARKGHFAGPELLESQLAELEEPQDAVTVQIDNEPEEIVEQILRSAELTTD